MTADADTVSMFQQVSQSQQQSQTHQQSQQHHSQSNQSNQVSSSNSSQQKPEPGKAPSRAGACRVCLKSFKPDDFSKICAECQQKVCEDCASYSKLDDSEDAVSANLSISHWVLNFLFFVFRFLWFNDNNFLNISAVFQIIFSRLSISMEMVTCARVYSIPNQPTNQPTNQLNIKLI